jgi:hypothetical protein
MPNNTETERYFVIEELTGEIRESDFKEWKLWMSRREYIADHRVDHTIISEAVWVMTVFVGYSRGEKPPLYFWTQVFGGALDESLWMSATRGEAKKAHWVAVDQCREIL